MVNFCALLDTKKAGYSKNGLNIAVPLIVCNLQEIFGKVQEVLTHPVQFQFGMIVSMEWVVC